MRLLKSSLRHGRFCGKRSKESGNQCAVLQSGNKAKRIEVEFFLQSANHRACELVPTLNRDPLASHRKCPVVRIFFLLVNIIDMNIIQSAEVFPLLSLLCWAFGSGAPDYVGDFLKPGSWGINIASPLFDSDIIVRSQLNG